MSKPKKLNGPVRLEGKELMLQFLASMSFLMVKEKNGGVYFL